MYIYLIKTREETRPDSQVFSYPKHNDDYGVEQDFYDYLICHYPFITDDPDKALWHYLPVYWTRWHLNHDYGKTGVGELENSLADCLTDSSRTFTICQYEDGPLIPLDKTTIFYPCRKEVEGYDIPLLSRELAEPWLFKPKSKKYLASFMGRISTHPLRAQMRNELSGLKDVFVYDGNLGTSLFVRKLLQSKVALCPRGYGGTSFRFYESMQLGVPPVLISDIDTRPFKNDIDWDVCSFYVKDVKELKSLLGNMDRYDTDRMGVKAKEVWYNCLRYGVWCKYVIKTLSRRNA